MTTDNAMSHEDELPTDLDAALKMIVGMVRNIREEHNCTALDVILQQCAIIENAAQAHLSPKTQGGDEFLDQRDIHAAFDFAIAHMPRDGHREYVKSIYEWYLQKLNEGYRFAKLAEPYPHYPDTAKRHAALSPAKPPEDVQGALEARKSPIDPYWNANTKPFPIQGFSKIPWFLAETAYAVYSARYGRSQTLQRLGERGGFHTSEMDEFYPDWRKHLAEFHARVAALTNAGAR